MSTPSFEPWAPADLREAATLRDRADVHLWLMALDDPPWPLEQLEAALDTAESARAARFHFTQDARRWRAARGLLRCVLGRYTGVPAHDLHFVVGAQGKPALTARGEVAPPSFNLSHSGAHALLGITPAAAIGVDIEVMRPLPDRDAIAAGHFAPAEQRALAALPDALRDDAFFAGWTRKEAYIKARGGGLSIPLADFEVSLDPRERAELRRGTRGPDEAAGWTLWSARAAPGVWAAAAVEMRPARLRLFRLVAG